ncbi:hypothetical protein H072_1580 [Dactylellina haptotyla CBS 200.50]|uniref:Serine hydrolase domain-containing protein n=1 Tax=Dactylellina haptotyla (strain CBS 200.50) TaxID=1284197 RepID=S8AU07_DACHA|nr:hypothetical protein H072_1580 [Dactylellina haptotyla CBS 200.50]
MRFLCLHGLGTNGKVLETQTAAIRAGLGDGHTYEFVDGTVPWPKAPELGDLFSDDEQYLAYYDPYNAESMLKALHQLERYIEEEGPFDAIMGFSHGCALSSTLLLGRACEKSRWQIPFKCAIFLAAGGPVSWKALHDGEVIWLDKSYNKSQITIPTAHVWALNDKWGLSMSAVLEQLSIPQMRHSHIHREGHTVPGRRSPETLRAAIKVIRRTIQEVETRSS